MSEQTESPRFCLNCRHIIIPSTGINYARCGKRMVGANLVTGESTYLYCEVARGELEDSQCGPKGNLWETT